MSPYYGDHIRKEREALDLIIRMKRKTRSSNVGELIFFVLMPLLMAYGVFHFKEIVLFCHENQWVSAGIKVIYPPWRSAGDSQPQPATQAVGTEQPATGLGTSPQPDGASTTAPDIPAPSASEQNAANPVKASEASNKPPAHLQPGPSQNALPSAVPESAIPDSRRKAPPAVRPSASPSTSAPAYSEPN